MELTPVRIRLIKPGDDLTGIVLAEFRKRRIDVRDRDVLLVSSKVVSVAEGRVVRLKDVSPSRRARTLAKKTNLDERQVELILRHADRIYGEVHRAFLTLKDNFLIANSGIDKSNSRNGEVILWPRNPQKAAERIREEILDRTKKHVGVAIVDSRIAPLRQGTTGLAIGVAGFHPVKDYRLKKDIFGKPLEITLQNLADDLACAAHLLMGEADERTPIVLARNAPVVHSSRIQSRSTFISPDKCLYMKALDSPSFPRTSRKFH